MTPKGEMSSSGSGPAIAHLPPHMKIMFDPLPPFEHKAPIVKKKMPALNGMAGFVDQFEQTTPPEKIVKETPKQRQERIRTAKMAAEDELMEARVGDWDPSKMGPKHTEDAYKTLFVGRISYDTTDRKLKREFERYGPVKSLRMVEDEEGRPRGYAFVEFEREADMRAAYKQGDGQKIDGRRVLVDVERGRTVREWRPRRFGGGMGGTRRGGKDVNIRTSGREGPISSSGDRNGERNGDSSSRYERSDRGGDRGYDRDRGGDRDRGYDRDRGGDRYGDRGRDSRRDDRDSYRERSRDDRSRDDRRRY